MITSKDSEICGRYERVIMELSSWIAEKTWDGHEKDCMSFAGGAGPCGCIKFWRDEGRKAMRLREIESIRDTYTDKAPRMPDLMPQMMALQARNQLLEHHMLLVFDILKTILTADSIDQHVLDVAALTYAKAKRDIGHTPLGVP